MEIIACLVLTDGVPGRGKIHGRRGFIDFLLPEPSRRLITNTTPGVDVKTDDLLPQLDFRLF
jgi:hypothetical protein